MKSVRMAFLLAFIILFSSCKDIIFNNPLDPEASKGEVIVLKVLNTNFPGEGELAFDGEKLWKIYGSGRLVAFDRETGGKIRELFIPSSKGLVFLDDYLYLSSSENYLTIVNPLSGDFISNLLTGEKYFEFITKTGDKIIGYDKKSSRFFLFDPESGESEELFKLTGFNIGGVSIYQGFLIITEKNSASIYLFNTNGKVEKVYSSPISDISGISVDENSYIYLASSDGKIYKITLP